MNSFVADPQLARIAEAYSLDVADMAAGNFQTTLDFSDASVSGLEHMLDVFHRQAAQAAPGEEQLAQLSKALGSYLGEVLRRNHGAVWGNVTLNGQTLPGMRLADGSLVWPWGRARNRLERGEAENVAHYFASLTRAA